MADKSLEEKLLVIIKEETLPALGCTEPVAVAYGASMAARYLKEDIDRLDVKVSKNIYKNGKSVIIPGTEEWGLDLAAALGFVGGNPQDELMVLKDIGQEHMEIAHRMLKEKKVKVGCLEDSPDVYVEIMALANNNRVRVVLEDAHNHISKIELDGKSVYEGSLQTDEFPPADFIRNMVVEDMIEVAETISIDSIAFIEYGIEMNRKAAETGLKVASGLNIGKGLMELEKKGKLKIDGSTKARILTAAAADLRMGGGNYPVMTSCGSGNQGLGVVIPITVAAEENGIAKGRLRRAIFLAHIINKYVKLHTGKLSAICGCAIGAGVGASAAISWMLGGNLEQISGAANNLLSNLTGMICDGAKDTCAFKLSTSAEEAVLAAYLAIENIIVRPNVGIIGSGIEATIKNLEILCKEGFSNTDASIINIISPS